ncbi:MAG: hypothetical protein WC604_01360 [Candidatus Gracilibacteria bacterium]
METRILGGGVGDGGGSDGPSGGSAGEGTGALGVIPDLAPRFAEAADFLTGRLGEIREKTNSQFPQMGDRTLRLILLPGGQRFFDALWGLVLRVTRMAMDAGINVGVDAAIFHNLSYERLADIFSDESFGAQLRRVEGLSDGFIGIVENVLSEGPVRRDTEVGIAYADTVSSLLAVGVVTTRPETHDTAVDGVVTDVSGDSMIVIPGAVKRKAGGTGSSDGLG